MRLASFKPMLALLPIAMITIAGCADNRLSELEVGDGDYVATYKVIDGM